MGAPTMPFEIRLFPCFKDNYGVLLHDPADGSTAAIDAPEAGPIDAALSGAGWRLTDILVTHHHADHTAGIAELKKRHGCRVVAPRKEAQKIPDVDVTVHEGDYVTVGTLNGRVLETPGHTLGHIAYWFKPEKLVFVGDTLFSVGCGRILEGTADQMWQSLLKLRNLPTDTQVYCGHEYTAANVHFALTIEPRNAALRARAEEVVRLCDAGKPTIPTTIASEKTTNPFLRADLHSVASAVSLEGVAPSQVFARIRSMKDKF
jgi:hydroxyacylglutathione hydrolase